jgi:tetratricopeptide (TPR) repeat protein
MKNKKLLLKTAFLLAIVSPAVAGDFDRNYMIYKVSTDMSQEQADPLAGELDYLQKEWARIKYQVPGDDRKLDALHQLETHAQQIASTYPNRPEALIWQGIILATDAGIDGGMSALAKVKEARALFETALRIDPQALDGSAYTSLGSLYYQVPGWPIGFGDDGKAEEYLKNALMINPAGIDPNYFYGDYLIDQGREQEAATYLQRALNAPPRPGRELADAGRRQEIKAALAKISRKAEGNRQIYN